MKECPKNNQIKVSKKNDIVSIEKIVGSVIELSTKRLFLIGQKPVKKGCKLFLLYSILEIEKIFKCFPHPPCDQANPLTYSCSFTLHTSYKNGILGQRREGR